MRRFNDALDKLSHFDNWGTFRLGKRERERERERAKPIPDGRARNGTARHGGQARMDLIFGFCVHEY